MKVKRHNLDSTEAISVNSKTSTTHGHLNALRDIKESRGIKIKNKIGQAYEQRHVSSDTTDAMNICVSVNFVCCISLIYYILFFQHQLD